MSIRFTTKDNRNNEMRKLRFIGTVKGISIATKRTIVSFAPDSECAATFKDGDIIKTYAVFIPTRDDEEGCVFKYDKSVKMSIKNTPSTSAIFSPDLHCALILCETKAKEPQVQLLDTSLTNKSYNIEEITFGIS